MAALIYYIGQDVGVTATVLDDDGSPATGTLAVILTVTDPAGGVTTPATTATGPSTYAAVVPAVAVDGVWLYRWTVTGPDLAWASEGQFQVRPAGAEQLVDLASVKAHLNIPPETTSNDDELQGFILAAAELARDVVGPLLPETHTEFRDGGTDTISLDWQPVASVLSVTEYVSASTFPLTEQPLGTSLGAYEYTVDLPTGQVTRRATGGAVRFPAGRKNVKVVYVAGRSGAIPYTVRLGTLELIRHLWQQTQQGDRPRWSAGSGAGGESASVPMGFALPARVLELWAPYRLAPGVA